MKKSEQQLQRYRFPDAAAAHDYGGLALLDEEIYAVQDSLVVEGFRYVVEFEVVVRHFDATFGRRFPKSFSNDTRNTGRGTDLSEVGAGSHAKRRGILRRFAPQNDS
ncbi:MAG: hypothetical protein ABSF78_17500 [Candidatus Acidiferrales bacterium]